MEAIINAFGIDARLIIVQMINFGILMVALGYFLYKPILGILKEREEKITQGLKDAESAAIAKAEAGTEKQHILTQAHSEAEEIGLRAKTAAETKANDILTSAQEKAASVLADAELKREQIKNLARKDSEAEIAKLAILATEKVLRGNA